MLKKLKIYKAAKKRNKTGSYSKKDQRDFCGSRLECSEFYPKKFFNTSYP